MASVQPRANKWQLRVQHKLLPKPFFCTFDNEVAARNYGEQLEALLSMGVVPQEMLAGPDLGASLAASPLLRQVIQEYIARANPARTSTDTLAQVMGEVAGLRVSGVTFAWAEDWIKRLKVRKNNVAPSTIRQRVQALARVLDWHFVQEHKKQDNPGAQLQVNVLRMLPKSYSAYPDGTRKDVHRDLRLGAGDEAKIRAIIAGEKRADRERPWANEPEFDLLFDLIVNTGLRLREAYWLRVEQVDLPRRLLRVDGTKGHRGQIKPRVVPIGSALRDKLDAACEGKRGSALIFPYWDGTQADLPKCSARLSARFSTLFDYAGMPHFTEHDLRHEACCRWVTMRLADGRGWLFNEIEVCRIMGWSDPKMLMRYASLRGEDLSSRLA